MRRRLRQDASGIAVAVTVCVILAVCSYRLLEWRSYDPYDDFQKYFAHPVRMLGTGTLYASPLSAMGSETLGAKAFLDAFVVAYLPFTYINAIDGLLAVLLCLILIAQITQRRGSLVGVTIIAMVVFWVIDPLMTNITPIYLCSALLLGVITFLTREDERLPDGYSPNPAPLGLLYAALLALKLTFGLFIVVQVGLAAIVVAVASRSLWRGFRWGVSVGVLTILFLLPWVLIHVPHYWAALSDPYIGPAIPPAPASFDISLFSFEQFGYIVSLGSYTTMVGLALLFSALAISCAIKLADRSARIAVSMLTSCVVATAIVYPIMMCVMSPRLYGYPHSLRYFAPIAIVVTPASLCLASVLASRMKSASTRKAILACMIVMAILGAASFKMSIVQRYSELESPGTTLAYAPRMSPEYLNYVDHIDDGPTRDKVRRLRNLVPAGETVLVWINAPFYLDYSRNPIADVDIAGVCTTWARLPRTRYVIWDYAGFPTFRKEDLGFMLNDVGAMHRLRGVRVMETIQTFIRLVQSGEIVYNDHSTVVVRLPNDAEIAAPTPTAR